MKFLDGAEPPQRTRLAPRHLPRPHRATPLGHPATHKTTNSSKMLSPTKGKHDECQTAARRITPADPRQTEGRGHNAKLTSREPRPMSERTERVEVKRSSAPRRGRGGAAPSRAVSAVGRGGAKVTLAGRPTTPPRPAHKHLCSSRLATPGTGEKGSPRTPRSSASPASLSSSRTGR